MKPFVSIIIPTYNRAKLLQDALESVLQQKYQNWECLVIDDGSTQEVRELKEKICSCDSRINFHVRPPGVGKGASGCRNFGISKAKGELIQFLDDDDLLDKGKLAEQVKSYSESNDLSLFTGQWGGFTDQKDLKSRFKFKYHSYQNFSKGADLLNTFGLYNEYFPLHVYLTPRALIEKAGKWNEDLSNNDDAEFFTRIILNAKKIIFVPEARVHYRYNASEKLSVLNSEEKIQSVLKSWKLIEEHINQSNSRKAVKYYKRAKDNLFKYFEKNSSEIIKDHKEFFESRGDYSGSYYKSKIVWRKILNRMGLVL